MDNNNQLEDFLTSMGPQFHTRLLLYYENLVKDTHKADSNMILNFEFPEGEYSIKYELLKQRADSETLQLLDDNGLKINMGPLRTNQPRIEKKEDKFIEVVTMKNESSGDADNGESI